MRCSLAPLAVGLLPVLGGCPSPVVEDNPDGAVYAPDGSVAFDGGTGDGGSLCRLALEVDHPLPAGGTLAPGRRVIGGRITGAVWPVQVVGPLGAGWTSSGTFRVLVDLSVPETKTTVSATDAAGCTASASAAYGVAVPGSDGRKVLAYVGFWQGGAQPRWTGFSGEEKCAGGLRKDYSTSEFFWWGPPPKETLGQPFPQCPVEVDRYDATRVVGPEPWRRDLLTGNPDLYPYIGPYDSLDSEVVRWHVRLAQAAGIDGFLTYYHPHGLGPIGVDMVDRGEVRIVALLARPDGAGSYLIESYGGLHPYGAALTSPGQFPYQGADVVRDAVLLADGRTVVALDKSGAVINRAALGFDTSALGSCVGSGEHGRALAISADKRGALVLTATGVCAAGTAVAPRWPAGSLVRDVLLTEDARGAFLLLADGTVVTGGTADAVVCGPLYPGQDRARRLALSSKHLFRLDADGRVHVAPRVPGGPPGPDLNGRPLWPGLDVAVDLTVVADGAGVAVLDRYGNAWRAGATDARLVVDPRDFELPRVGERFATVVRALWTLKRVAEQEGFAFSAGDFTMPMDGLGKPAPGSPEYLRKFDRWRVRAAYVLMQVLDSPAYLRIAGQAHFEVGLFWDYSGNYSSMDASEIRSLIVGDSGTDGLEDLVNKDLFVSAYLGWDPRTIVAAPQLRMGATPGAPAGLRPSGIDVLAGPPQAGAVTEACRVELDSALPLFRQDQQNQGYVPAMQASPAYDERGARHRMGLRKQRYGGQRFRDQLEAIRATNFPVVFLENWNAWGEGSVIEPALGYRDKDGSPDPYLYLRLLAAARGRAFVPPPLPPPIHVESLRRAALFAEACPGDCVADAAGRTPAQGDCYGLGKCVASVAPCDAGSGEVCGWDGVTYANDCALAPRRRLHLGACGSLVCTAAEPACGVDGRTYATVCDMLNARVHRANPGPCAPWLELFPNDSEHGFGAVLGPDPYLNRIVRGLAAGPAGDSFFMIDSQGGAYGTGGQDHCSLMASAPSRLLPLSQAPRALAAGASGGVYLALADGTVRTTPGAPAPLSPSFPLWPGQDVVRDLVLTPSENGLALLDRGCGLNTTGAAPAFAGILPRYTDGAEHCIAAAYTPSGAGAYVLDRNGTVHRAGDAIATGATPLFGFDIARDIAARSDGAGYYVLDGYGGVHCGGGAAAPVYNLGSLNPGGVDQWYTGGVDQHVRLVLLEARHQILVLRNDGRIFAAALP